MIAARGAIAKTKKKPHPEQRMRNQAPMENINQILTPTAKAVKQVAGVLTVGEMSEMLLGFSASDGFWADTSAALQGKPFVTSPVNGEEFEETAPFGNVPKTSNLGRYVAQVVEIPNQTNIKKGARKTMIKKPSDITAAGKKFSMIIYGEPGIGKTTLGCSAPAPVLCDFDRGVLRVRAEHRKDTIEVSSYDEFLSDLGSEEVKGYETLIIDTAGSMVSMMFAKYDKELNTKDPRKVYGAIKAEFTRLTGQIRDAMNKNVIYIFHSAEESKNDKTVVRLLCEGSAKNIVWAPCDFGGYVFREKGDRFINFTSTDEAFAKGCHGIHGKFKIPELSTGDKNEFITQLFNKARKNIEEEDSANSEAKAAYDAVIKAGEMILKTVKDAKTANAAKDKLLKLEEVSTSKQELSSKLKKKANDVGLKYDKEAGGFVSKEPEKTEPDTEDIPEEGDEA